MFLETLSVVDLQQNKNGRRPKKKKNVTLLSVWFFFISGTTGAKLLAPIFFLYFLSRKYTSLTCFHNVGVN